MSFLNSSTSTLITTPIPSHITKVQVLSFLHNNLKILTLNPNFKSQTLLASSRATTFFSAEAASLKPPSPEDTPVYEVTEDMSGDSSRGWAKRFVPETISYESSMENLEDGMRCITHAPLGVHSVTTWTLKDVDGGLVLEETGKVTSNRMLMSFIKGGLQGDHEKLVKDFMAALEKEVSSDGEGGEQVS